MSSGTEIMDILSRFEPISLEEVNKASLMRRKDNKYFFSYRHLPDLLDMVIGNYRVLEIDGSRSQQYHTRYFDTDGREMYHKHHRGLSNRHKVRIRRYGSGDLHFLEVKMKNSKGVTSKKRVQASGMDHDVILKEEAFLLSCSPYNSRSVDLTLENDFNRITLVSHAQTERVTLDYSLRFSNYDGTETMDLPGVAIAEIKFENHLSGSSMHEALRRFRIRPRRFSKYAIGMALLHPDLKQNRFKSKVRKVHQINESYHLKSK